MPARIDVSVPFLQPAFGIAISAAIFGDTSGPLFSAGVASFGGVGLTVTDRRPSRAGPGVGTRPERKGAAPKGGPYIETLAE